MSALTELSAGDIASRFDMTKPSLSKHLKILEAAGLVKADKRGSFVFYSLQKDSLANTLTSFVQQVCPVFDQASQAEQGDCDCQDLAIWKRQWIGARTVAERTPGQASCCAHTTRPLLPAHHGVSLLALCSSS
ncbi:MAG: transcriptional regulator [Burkholderiales bacterium]|nr:MAG: transcriptional regulator [Burkholderiales bacterium]